MEFSTTTFPRARASWTCLECGRTIRPGERYEKIRGKFEGEFVTYRTCIGCQRLRDDLRCCGGALDEVVRECFGVGIRDAKPASPVDLG
jgi:hypothetical protein